MNSLLKNALVVTLLLPAGSAVCKSGDDIFFGGFSHEAPVARAQSYWEQVVQASGFSMARAQGYCEQAVKACAQGAEYAKTASTQLLDYVRANTPECPACPEWVVQTCAYLAEMPKHVEGASLNGYATADNAKNILTKVGAAAAVAVVTYGIYKVAFKKTKKEESVASCRLS